MGTNKEIESLIPELKAQGWELNDTNDGRYIAYPPEAGRPPVRFSKRAQEVHAFNNTIRFLRQSGFRWPPPSKREQRAAARKSQEVVRDVEPHITSTPFPPVQMDIPEPKQFLPKNLPGPTPLIAEVIEEPMPPAALTVVSKTTTVDPEERLYFELRNAKAYEKMARADRDECDKRLTSLRGEYERRMRELRDEYEAILTAAARAKDSAEDTLREATKELQAKKCEFDLAFSAA